MWFKRTKPASSDRIAVYGAAGHTGRFVVREVMRGGLTPIAVGRDQARLAAALPQGHEIACRTASLDDAASLDAAFAGAACVVNCAGPFLDTAEPVARAALRARAHYLDVTAEQASASATLEAFDTASRKARIAVIPAMGFYGGFADLLITAALGKWRAADAIEIVIGLDSWHPTIGTRATGKRNTVRRVVVRDGRLAPMNEPAATKRWEFPAPLGSQTVVEVPFSEMVLVHRHVRAKEVRTYLGDVGLKDIADPSTPAPEASDASGRSAQRFVVEAIVRRGTETRRIVAQGRDIYAFSAVLLCEAAQRLLAGDFTRAGAHAPGEIFDARDFLEALAPEHLTLELNAA